jgi:UDP-N-acetylmuramoyl-tripeptide--D-alanyl-D-alanine ligase
VAQVLVAVGPRAHWIGEEALAVGMNPQQVFIVERTDEAIPLLEGLIQANDFVLVKGSLGMHMDRIVAALGRDGVTE